MLDYTLAHGWQCGYILGILIKEITAIPSVTLISFPEISSAIRY